MSLLPGYSQQRQITLDNGGPGAAVMSAAGNCLVAVQVPTDWALLGSKNDLRVVRSLDGGVTGVEVGRQILNNGPFLAPTAAQAAVFNLLADIPAAGTDTTYWLVGVNAGAGAPPTTLTTDTTGRLEDFEDNVFQQFLHAHGNGTLDTARSFAGMQSLKLTLNGNGCFVSEVLYFWGTGLDFYWSTDTANGNNHLAYHIDNGNTAAYTVVGSGANAFGAGNHVTIAGLSNSLHRVEFFAHSGDGVVAGLNAVWIDNLTVTGCPVVYAPAFTVAASTGIQSFNYTVPFGSLYPQPFQYDLVSPFLTLCWESYTQRLLGYLGAPFRKSTSGLLWTLMSAIARELTGCVETVTLVSAEGRGAGTFTFPVTFDPVAQVTGARRVDSLGNLLEAYTVVSWDGRQVTVSGIQPPRAGDFLQVDYSYIHTGLQGRLSAALAELNILTATGTFLDAWGTLFGMTRVKTGTYGSSVYGPDTVYGVEGVEGDGSFARRIIDRVIQGRNTDVAIVAAMKRLTGGNPYIVTWFDGGGNNAWIFRPTGAPAWAGEADTRKHLIWGRTARFLNSGAPNGGAFVFDVWVPTGSGFSKSTLQALVDSLKPAGSKAFIRYIP